MPHPSPTLLPSPDLLPGETATINNVIETPHFAIPFRLDTSVVVNEQDSDDDVAACVEAIIRYQKGQREAAPDFGIADMTFSQAPVNAASIITDIENQEPRARSALYEIEDELDRARSYEEGIAIVAIATGVRDAS